MAVLRNSRHEQFAQNLAKGMTQEQAYVAAGYVKTNARKAASFLLTKVDVASRVEQIKAKVAEKVEWTIADAIMELEEARIAAHSAETVQASAMVNATMSKAKLLGMVIDQKEIAGKNGNPIEAVTRIELVPVRPNDNSKD